MPLLSQYLEAAFGVSATGLGTVGYELFDTAKASIGARSTTGVGEVGASGTYGVLFASIPDTAATILWDTGGGSPVTASEDLDPYHDRNTIVAATTATAVAASILDALIGGAIGADSVREALVAARGLLQMNFILDNTTHNSVGVLTAGRIRLFDIAANVPALGGGSEVTGLLLTVNLDVATETSDAKLVETYRAVKA